MFSRLSTVSFGLPEEATMSAPVVNVDILHRRILATNAALHGARAAMEHCPSVENEMQVAVAERRLNELLDRLPRGTSCNA